MKVNVGYYWSTLLPEQMLAAIKHVADDILCVSRTTHLYALCTQHIATDSARNSQLRFS